MSPAYQAGDTVVCMIEPRPRPQLIIERTLGGRVAMVGATGYFFECLADPLEEAEMEEAWLPERTCANCVHSQSLDPKCGLCCGPYSPITRYERKKDEPSH